MTQYQQPTLLATQRSRLAIREVSQTGEELTEAEPAGPAQALDRARFARFNLSGQTHKLAGDSDSPVPRLLFKQADANTHTFSPCHGTVCLRFPDRKCSEAAKKFERWQPKQLTTLSACAILPLIKKLWITSQFHLQPPASGLECRGGSWEVFCFQKSVKGGTLTASTLHPMNTATIAWLC